MMSLNFNISLPVFLNATYIYRLKRTQYNPHAWQEINLKECTLIILTQISHPDWRLNLNQCNMPGMMCTVSTTTLMRQAPTPILRGNLKDFRDMMTSQSRLSTCQVDTADHEDHLAVSLLLHVYVASRPDLILDTCNRCILTCNTGIYILATYLQ